MNVFELDGRPVEAAFDLVAEADGLAIVLHPRGGSGPQRKNREYRLGLVLTLQRIRAIGGEIIRQREGQPEFRRSLLRAYDRRCASPDSGRRPECVCA
jgi:hypothetical protein